MSQRRRRIQQPRIDAPKRRVVIVQHRMPQLRGVLLGHLHDLVGVAVAQEISLLDAVEERIGDVPGGAVGDDETKGQSGLVEIREEADGEVAELDVLEVEARGGEVEVGGEAGDQQSKIAKAGDGGDEGRGGERW